MSIFRISGDFEWSESAIKVTKATTRDIHKIMPDKLMI